MCKKFYYFRAAKLYKENGLYAYVSLKMKLECPFCKYSTNEVEEFKNHLMQKPRCDEKGTVFIMNNHTNEKISHIVNSDEFKKNLATLEEFEIGDFFFKQEAYFYPEELKEYIQLLDNKDEIPKNAEDGILISCYKKSQVKIIGDYRIYNV